MDVTTAATVHRAGEGPGTWAMGSLFEHLVSAGQSGGSLGVSLVTQPPGIATPLHRHTAEAEALFVLEGEISYRAGDEVHELVDGWVCRPPRCGCPARTACRWSRRSAAGTRSARATGSRSWDRRSRSDAPPDPAPRLVA